MGHVDQDPARPAFPNVSLVEGETSFREQPRHLEVLNEKARPLTTQKARHLTTQKARHLTSEKRKAPTHQKAKP